MPLSQLSGVSQDLLVAQSKTGTGARYFTSDLMTRRRLTRYRNK